MNSYSHVPPGFRFYPTDEELVDYYLRKKITSKRIDLNVIKDVDLYKIEPWDLQEYCRIGTEDQQHEWHFFSHKDKKYPTGTRTNRATKTGFWKAIGRDKPIYTKLNLIGMRKTLVYYIGRAPNGQKTDWIMHEYRLESNENGTSQEEGWVVCKVFKKRVSSTIRKGSEVESLHWFDENLSFMPELNSPNQDYNSPNDPFHQLACSQSSKLPNFSIPGSSFKLPHFQSQLQTIPVCSNSDSIDQTVGEVTDWRILDKFVASQLSHEELSTQNFQVPAKKEAPVEFESASNSICAQIKLWM